jgi:hypothetical protein
MCDYSLQNVASRPAKVGDKLTTRHFGTVTLGSRPRKMRGWLFVFCQGPNWHLPDRSNMNPQLCLPGAERRSITKQRFFGRSTESA